MEKCLGLFLKSVIFASKNIESQRALRVRARGALFVFEYVNMYN